MCIRDSKQRWGLAPDSFENWERLWRHNPALTHQNSDRPIGWVLEADSAVVGYMGNISLQYRYGAAALTAVASHGLVVELSLIHISMGTRHSWRAVEPFVKETPEPHYLHLTAFYSCREFKRLPSGWSATWRTRGRSRNFCELIRWSIG